MTEELSGRRIVVPEGRELGATRKITRGPKPVRALREIGSDTIIPADEPTTKGLITAMRRLDLSGRYVGVQLNPGNPNPRLMDFIVTAGGRARSSVSLCLRL